MKGRVTGSRLELYLLTICLFDVFAASPLVPPDGARSDPGGTSALWSECLCFKLVPLTVQTVTAHQALVENGAREGAFL